MKKLKVEVEIPMDLYGFASSQIPTIEHHTKLKIVDGLSREIIGSDYLDIIKLQKAPNLTVYRTELFIMNRVDFEKFISKLNLLKSLVPTDLEQEVDEIKYLLTQ